MHFLILAKMVTSKRVYNWYIAMVAAGCMVLTGYDASVFNALQNSAHWVKWFGSPVCYSNSGLENGTSNKTT